MANKNKVIIVGNWKMGPETVLEAKRIISSTKRFISKISGVKVIVSPPFVYSNILSHSANKEVLLGAQDVSVFKDGSHTGEISANMLKKNGFSFCIVGHSERRANGETDEMVSDKVSLLLEEKICPIICIGESSRDELGGYLEFIRDQIKNSLAGVSKKNALEIIIAYEPIWAIGAKEPMKTSDIHETSLFIKKVLSDLYGNEIAFSIPILYGGTVNMRNAKEIVRDGEVNGLLVGRESINPPS
ncbi:MAG: triose-phosphate isomerase, partial [bacterium]|nr:triose-phosphate isomerase [bacterium]